MVRISLLPSLIYSPLSVYLQHFKKSGNWCCDWSVQPKHIVVRLLNSPRDYLVGVTERGDILVYNNQNQQFSFVKRYEIYFRGVCLIYPVGEIIVTMAWYRTITAWQISTGRPVNIFFSYYRHLIAIILCETDRFYRKRIRRLGHRLESRVSLLRRILRRWQDSIILALRRKEYSIDDHFSSNQTFYIPRLLRRSRQAIDRREYGDRSIFRHRSIDI